MFNSLRQQIILNAIFLKMAFNFYVKCGFVE
ncbi:Uncharacterised protein [Klebsiella quasipneumoniae]|nr:Uncharacterised protein [Klebsiella quasipneumoniae]